MGEPRRKTPKKQEPEKKEPESKEPKFDEEHDARVAEDLRSYLSMLNVDSEIRVHVTRLKRRGDPESVVAGFLHVFEEPVDEQKIKGMYGGGKYQLKISSKKANGRFEYTANRTIDIAGHPQIDDPEDKSRVTEGSDHVTKALALSQELAERQFVDAKEQRDRAREDARIAMTSRDPAVDLMQSQLEVERQRVAEKEAQIVAYMSRPPPESPLAPLFGKLVEGESVRLEGLRVQHASERAASVEHHQAEVSRLHGFYADQARSVASQHERAVSDYTSRIERMESAKKSELQRTRDTHQRDVEMVRQMADSAKEATSIAFASSKEGLERELAAAQKQLGEIRAELTTLQAQKDKGIVDQLADIARVKEAMDGWKSSGDGEKSEGGVVERVLTNVMGSNLVSAVAARIAEGVPAPDSMALAQAQAAQAAQAQQAQAQVPPGLQVNKPVRTPDGKVVMLHPDGKVRELKKRPDKPSIPADALEKIVAFMEGGLGNETDPAAFAQTIKTMYPMEGPLGKVLAASGVEVLLDQIEKSKPQSTLVTITGKAWCRQVFELLLPVGTSA